MSAFKIYLAKIILCNRISKISGRFKSAKYHSKYYKKESTCNFSHNQDILKQIYKNFALYTTKLLFAIQNHYKLRTYYKYQKSTGKKICISNLVGKLSKFRINIFVIKTISKTNKILVSW